MNALSAIKVGIIGFFVVAVLACGAWYYSEQRTAEETPLVTESVSEEVGEVAMIEDGVTPQDDIPTIARDTESENEPDALSTNDTQTTMNASMRGTQNEERILEKTLIAGGCFWCVESDLEKLTGVTDVVSGYAGGDSQNPTYKDYAEGGHREVVEVTYDPSVVSFREIIIYALKHMDPTDRDGSFGDRGREYAPALYYATESERATISAVVTAIDDLVVYEKPLAIDILPIQKFWAAEDYHQNYAKGTLTQLKYSYYRRASGRDVFIEKHWGSDVGGTLPVDSSGFDLSAWSSYSPPSDETLRAKLSDLQYEVTQNAATERAFQNEYWDNKAEGLYVDINSGEPLFSSRDKFDSGTGWPSFTKPIYPEAVTKKSDFLLVIPRTEIRSRFADSHLGHVFNDAPKELGGIRYCMNSASLRFIPKDNLEKEGYGQFITLFN